MTVLVLHFVKNCGKLKTSTSWYNSINIVQLIKVFALHLTSMLLDKY